MPTAAVPILLLQLAVADSAPVTAVPVDRRPALDGRLDDAVWALAPPSTRLIQRDPTEGAAVSEATEVRILYDDDALYVAARLFDSRPGEIVSRLGRRDATTHSDEFRLLLDSYHDHRTAFAFIVNPAGVQRDVFVGEDGGTEDASWDAVWEAATAVDSLGWVVELRIPFSQLRFSTEGEPVWGVRFERWIQRKNELALFPFVAKTETGVASRFAHLRGLRGLTAPKRFELLPYAVGRGRYDRPSAGNPFDDGSTYFRGGGVDLKYGVSSNLTLDAAVNPDFGQVELDATFVNLTAFEQFLSERRPFFVEGADIFTFGGDGGGVNHFGGTPLMFYSRRVGRPPQGQPTSSGPYRDIPANTTILGAAKLTGRTAGGWSVGVLDALTAREQATVTDTLGVPRDRHDVEPPTNYFVGRVKRASPSGNTSLGVLATAVNRWSQAPALDVLPTVAHAAGADFFHRWGQNRYTIAASVAGSYVQGDTLAIQQLQRASHRYYQRPDARQLRYDPERRTLAGVSGDLYLNKVAGAWRWGLAGSTTTPGFEVNDLGFQTRVDRVSAAAALAHHWTRLRGVFRQAYALVSLGPSWNYDGDPIQRTASAFGYAQLRNFWSLDWSASYSAAVLDDRLTRGGPLAAKPAAWYGSVDVYSDDRSPIGAYLFGSYTRDDAGGWSLYASPQLTFRPGPHLSLNLSAGYTAGRAAAQYLRNVTDTSATATLGTRYVFAELGQRSLSATLRLNATFSPLLSLQLSAQAFAFAGDYAAFKELRARKTFTFNRYGRDNGSTIRDTLLVSETDTVPGYVVDPDGPADSTATRFTFQNPDFRTRSVKVNAVLRWEYRPGSTLFVVWTHSRSGYVPYDAGFDLRRDFERELFLDKPTNVLLVKVNYWLSF